MIRRALSVGVAVVAAPALAALAYPAASTVEPVAEPPVVALPAAPAAPALGGPVVATVGLDVVDGLTVVTDTDRRPYAAYSASFPRIPGAEAWEPAFTAVLDDAVASVERHRTGPDAAAELDVGWQLVAASPQVIGARVLTREVHAGDATGVSRERTRTLWFDVDQDAPAEAVRLLRPDTGTDLAARLLQAARLDGAVDPGMLEDVLGDRGEAFDALAFGTDGRLVVELDSGTVADPRFGPVAVAVDPDGLLSPLGEAARVAAAEPSDPGLYVPPPAPAPAAETPGAVDCAVLRCVALTFDDGPVAETAQVLDALEARGARGTFFVVGPATAGHPGLIRRMAEGGHTVANHTWSHPRLPRLSSTAVAEELRRTTATIEKVTGTRPTLMRPPYGLTDTTVAAAAGREGLAVVLWDVDTADWRDRDADVVVERTLARTTPGSIVLLHDIHPSTRAAVPRIVDGLQRRGYTLVTVPELLPGAQPGRTYTRR